MMTREDMLRELELLPMWQLRTPLPSLEPVQARPKNEKPLVVDAKIKKIAAVAPRALRHIGSENGDFLFVMANDALQADEAHLLKNICKAMRIIAGPEQLPIDTLAAIQARPPKIIIAMGDPATQTLLQSTAPLTTLRGKLYQYHDFPLIATYDLAHLLQNLPDKAKVWDDLRLAMQVIQDAQL